MVAEHGKESRIVRDLKSKTLTRSLVARRNGVSTAYVAEVARAHGISTRARNNWTEEEIEFLRANYKRLGPRAIADVLERHRSYGSACHKAKELGLVTDVGPYGRGR